MPWPQPNVVDLEVAVHGLDLAQAPDLEPLTTPEAIGVVRSGRRPLLEPERARLGERADPFPLLA